MDTASNSQPWDNSWDIQLRLVHSNQECHFSTIPGRGLFQPDLLMLGIELRAFCMEWCHHQKDPASHCHHPGILSRTLSIVGDIQDHKREDYP